MIFFAVFMTASITVLYSMSSERQLIDQTAHSNADMARLLTHSHWTSFTQLLAAGRILPADQSAGARVYSLLEGDLKSRLRDSRIVDVRIYDMQGKAVFTVDHTGQSQPEYVNATLLYTYSDYITNSYLINHDRPFSLNGGATRSKSVVMTRLPMLSPLTQQQSGSIEILADVSTELLAIRMMSWKLMGWLGLFVAMTGIWLFRIFKRAGEELQTAQQEVVDYQMEAGRLAVHEPLTGLLNRGSFHRKYDGILKRCRRSGNLFGMIAIDLDDFGGINEAFGYEAGDKLLQVMARRLKASVRETDYVFRLDGDRFVVLLDDISKYADAYNVAEKLHQILHKPINYGEFDVRMTACCSVVVYPADGQKAELLERRMYVAMARAKAAGGNQILRYSDKLLKVA